MSPSSAQSQESICQDPTAQECLKLICDVLWKPFKIPIHLTPSYKTAQETAKECFDRMVDACAW